MVAVGEAVAGVAEEEGVVDVAAAVVVVVAAAAAADEEDAIKITGSSEFIFYLYFIASF